ncbi:MAG: hypothetical protein OIN66_14675 [Candidatus Methanoperedens sp.]|nr:hypothetical protein [Candidatus Methanoperedens sp.]
MIIPKSDYSKFKILESLLIGEKNHSELASIHRDIPYKTFNNYLKYLFNEGFIVPTPGKDRREKFYKLTSHGCLYLNKLDHDLRAQYFIYELERGLAIRFLTLTAHDRRLPEQDLNDIDAAIDNLLKPAISNRDIKKFHEYIVSVHKIFEKNNLSQPFQPSLDQLDNLKNMIGEIVLFVVAKSIQDNRPDYLTFLQYLPKFFHDIIKGTLGNTIDPDYILSNIKDTPNLECMLTASQNITPEAYQKLIKEAIEVKKQMEKLTKELSAK